MPPPSCAPKREDQAPKLGVLRGAIRALLGRSRRSVRTPPVISAAPRSPRPISSQATSEPDPAGTGPMAAKTRGFETSGTRPLCGPETRVAGAMLSWNWGTVPVVGAMLSWRLGHRAGGRRDAVVVAGRRAGRRRHADQRRVVDGNRPVGRQDQRVDRTSAGRPGQQRGPQCGTEDRKCGLAEGGAVDGHCSSDLTGTRCGPPSHRAGSRTTSSAPCDRDIRHRRAVRPPVRPPVRPGCREGRGSRCRSRRLPRPSPPCRAVRSWPVGSPASGRARRPPAGTPRTRRVR